MFSFYYACLNISILKKETDVNNVDFLFISYGFMPHLMKFVLSDLPC